MSDDIFAPALSGETMTAVNSVAPVIDDAEVPIWKRWKVEKHLPLGRLLWEPDKAVAWRTEVQKKGGILSGERVYEALKGKRLLNACHRDYFSQNPSAIIDIWEDKQLFFWGTIYRRFGHGLYVPWLCVGNMGAAAPQGGVQVTTGERKLNSRWAPTFYAAVLSD